jgi:hypothetical protein
MKPSTVNGNNIRKNICKMKTDTIQTHMMANKKKEGPKGKVETANEGRYTGGGGGGYILTEKK